MRLSLAWVAGVALGVAASGAWAQEVQQYFQIFKGRVQSRAAAPVRAGDQVVAVVGGETFTASVDAGGEFSSLTIVRSSNAATQITFEVRRGSARFAYVLSETDTAPITLAFSGSNNPLSAAFNAQTLTGFIGPSLGSGGGNGGNGNGDGDDEDRDRGDVDGDGMITIEDARMVMRFIVGNRDGVDVQRLDVNGDLRVTTDDVILILRRNGEAAVVPGGGEEEES
ncbi:MAG: dockerin type I domain-containing protein [Phycisphaerales bacterium]